MANALLVATMKDEGPHLLEWVAHHRLVGFSRILVFENDSFDRTDRMLRVMTKLGILEYHKNDRPAQEYQNRAYRRAGNSDAFRDSEWCMALDGDEFLHVHAGSGTLDDLIAETPDADSILINWRTFGSAGEQRISDDLITERFRESNDADAIRGTTAEGFKSLFRTSVFGRPGIHRPKKPKAQTDRIYNGSGLRQGEFREVGWRSFDPGARANAQVNHYGIRDVESFLVKTLSGKASHFHRPIGLRYWRVRDFHGQEDTGLARRSDAIRAEMQRLDDLSGGRLMELRARSLRLWRDRVDDILSTDEGRGLFERICELRDRTGAAA